MRTEGGLRRRHSRGAAAPVRRIADNGAAAAKSERGRAQCLSFRDMRTGAALNEKDYCLSRGLSYIPRHKALKPQMATNTAGWVRIDGAIRHLEAHVYNLLKIMR